MTSTKPLAIIYGVGPGLGLSLAKAFSRTHSLALMSRNLANLQPFVDELTNDGADVKAFASEATEDGLTSAFDKIRTDFGGREVSVGCWNGSFRPSFRPFLESTTSEFEQSVATGIIGPSVFSRLILPLMLDKPLPSDSLASRGSLLFTGATASRKGSAKFSTFAVGKFGLTALAQSLSREFSPEGIHVAHVVLDGRLGDEPEERIHPDSIAKSYVYLANQERDAYTFELDLRPSSEKW